MQCLCINFQKDVHIITQLNYLLIKTKLKVWPVALVTASRMCIKVGVHGLASKWTPEKEYISPLSPYVACFLGTLCIFP